MPHSGCDFIALPTVGTCPLTVQFIDLTPSAGYTIFKWYWDFGDGESSTQQNPKHTYLAPGSYDVTLTVYVRDEGGGGSVVTISFEAHDKTDSKKKVGYIKVISTLEQERFCLRLATEENEGEGWAECSDPDDGVSMVDPELGGVYTILDDNEIQRCIVEDNNYIWELDTFDRVNSFVPPPKDMAAYNGTGGVEITGSKWGKEHTAGPGQEGDNIYDELSKVIVRPSDPENRSETGYTAAGLRSAQSFGLDVYTNGEKITATAVMSGIPDDSQGEPAGVDIVYPGVRVEGNRIQYVYNFAASEFLFVEMTHKILNKPSASPVHLVLGTSQAEFTLQKEMATNLVTWVTRSKLLYDRASKATCAIDTGTTVFSNSGSWNIACPDGWMRSGIMIRAGSVQGGVKLPNPAVAGNYTMLLWYCKTFGLGVWLGTIGVDYSPPSIWSGINWGLRIYKYAGLGAAIDIQQTANNSLFLYDIRIYNKVISAAAIANYYRNVIVNKGSAYLPAYSEV